MMRGLNDVRINDLNMTLADAVLKMCGGNPGSIVACTELIARASLIDPDAFSGGFAALMDLDVLHIYDEKIYMLWNDVCHRDIGKVMAILRAYQLGQLAGATEENIIHAIEHRGEGLDMEAVVATVRQRLPNFNPEAR